MNVVRLGARGVAALIAAALVLPWSVPARAEDPPPETITDTTSYTFSDPAGGIGTFAQRTISRKFDRPIAALTLYIVAGRADDIGYVGSQLVTSTPAQCSDVGTVTGRQDVSSQVAIHGDTATFVLRAQENCCCTTGWGSATAAGRTDATFEWHVTLGNATTAAVTATEPIIPTDARVQAGCVQYRADLTGTVTKAGQPQAGVNLQFKSDRGAADTLTQPTATTNASGTATGRIKTRKQGTARISAANTDIATPSPAAIVFGAADYEEKFLRTGYITADEADYGGDPVQPCGLDRAYVSGFLFGRGITMQGSGQDAEGRIIQVDAARNRREGLTGRDICFKYVACATGNAGGCVTADHSIAVDTHIIPQNASVDVADYGQRVADDTGGAIRGYHIDLYLGLGLAAARAHAHDPLHGTIRYLSGGGSCN